MTATVNLYVYTGTDAGTENGPISGIDLISADNAQNSLANRNANPISVGARSYEKWIRAKVDAAPDNYVTNFKVWGDGAVQTGTTLRVGTTSTGQTPTNGASSVATLDWTNYVAGSELTWDSSKLSLIGDKTRFLVFQLEAGASAPAGNWTQETVYYQYDEQ